MCKLEKQGRNQIRAHVKKENIEVFLKVTQMEPNHFFVLLQKKFKNNMNTQKKKKKKNMQADA